MLYEINIRLNNSDPGKSALIIEVLGQLGFDISSVVESETVAATLVSLYSDKKRKADFFCKSIRKMKLKGIKVFVAALKDKDWKSKWTRYYKPFKITEEIKVIPHGLKRSRRFNSSKNVFIKTDVIFGSGLHETTRYMAEFIRLKRNSLGSFLDIGMGTGLLSIIARKYGAQKISCIDIDPQAVANASFNFKINKVRPDNMKALGLKCFKTKNTYDFVAANLLTQDLIEMNKKIISLVSPGGYLAVSGVSLDNYKEFRGNFDDGSLKCLRVKKGREWTGILYKKKEARTCCHSRIDRDVTTGNGNEYTKLFPDA